jgi:hypothetical protein
VGVIPEPVVTDRTGDGVPASPSATIEPLTNAPPDEVAVALRIVNDTDASVELLNPDLGRPTVEMNWPWSDDTYRASLLMSFGYLAVDVVDEAGRRVDRQIVETWATPVLRPPVTLSPGDELDVPIPIGRFFELAPGHTYEVTVVYGDRERKVSGAGSIDVRDGRSDDG